MKSQYRYSFLHFSLFVGALILENQLIFFAFAVAAGLVPKFKYRFGYYTFLALLAIIVAFFIKPNYGPLIDVLDQVLALRTISLNLLIALVSALTLGLVARASSQLFLIIMPAKVNKEKGEYDYLDDDDEFYEV